MNGIWPFPPRESKHRIGYVNLFAALLRSIDISTAQFISALASATLPVVVTLLPITQNSWEPSLEADQPGGPEMRQSGGGHVEQMLGGKPQPLLLIHDHMSFA